MRKIIAIIVPLLFTIVLKAQVLTPVHWTFSSRIISDKEAVLILKAKIDKEWHIYSQYTPDGGPVPTSFRFKASPEYSLIDQVKEKSKSHKSFEEAFGVDVISFSNEAVFEQKINIKKSSAFKITGDLEYMVCNDSKCLPPETIEFSFDIKAEASTQGAIQSSDRKEEKKQEINSASSQDQKSSGETIQAVDSEKKPEAAETKTNKVSTPDIADQSLWSIFIGGFLGGFLALLTPCVFPMIPLTVSYFTKRAGNRSKSVLQASIYGVSIIVIYVLLGLGVTVLFGADALNDLASNVYFNLVFFLMLVVFGISFLGAFEITLPSSFVNKIDSKADRGGLIGIFFMAFTLSLVSFSCTGPIIGTLLVQAAVSGSTIGPLMGMTGFSLALALPFTLFAIFPSWMHSLPKSGGWLNSVKVVLGFLEIAFALKFLSNVDLAYHWGILDREVFLVLWIMIFALLGFYLLGKIRFSHDSETTHISIPRLFMAIISLAFSLYMVPGLWGAPLKAISAFTPPQETQDFNLNEVHSSSSPSTQTSGKKYTDLFHCPHNLDCFFDYDQAMAHAKQVNKPLMIDFTGHSCVNCRKMEASVWADPGVLKKLSEDYVLVSLYVDDKTELPEADQYVSSFSGKKIKTIGNKWSDLQASKYGTNSQPYYVLLDHKGEQLNTPRGFDQDINAYIEFLQTGLKNFRAGI